MLNNFTNIFPTSSTVYNELYHDCSIVTHTHQHRDTIAYHSTIYRQGEPHPTFLNTQCTVGQDTIHLWSEVAMLWYRKLIIDVTIPNPYSPTYAIATFAQGPDAHPKPGELPLQHSRRRDSLGAPDG